MADQAAGGAAAPRRCFVVMGFGIKTDFATGRQLDLNKTYRLLIKPVVEEKGLVCVRADEIRHSGMIDVPMYQELLTADVVIADLSTANPNALYELGIRHALRPRTTIVMAESKLPYPFDLNHIVINSYTHLGEAIDYDEVMRFRALLGATIEAVMKSEAADSPIYTVLKELVPPALGGRAAAAVERAGKALDQAADAVAAAASLAPPLSGADDETLAGIVAKGEEALRKDEFVQAHTFFALAAEISQKRPKGGAVMHDPYLVQRMVLATYKAKQPDEVTALKKALETLAPLDPDDSNDPETVGLAGAIRKRLFEQGDGDAHLDAAIRHYGRGYYLRNDRYNGINLAYLLNVRADTALDATDPERIADLVWANRIRREVLALCEREMAEIHGRETRTGAMPEDLRKEQTARDKEQAFWCLATKGEAHFGLGEMEAYERTRADAERLKFAEWAMGTFDGQVNKLRKLLEKHGHLLAPPWPGASATGGAAG